MALSQADKDRWAEIDSILAEHKTILKEATTHETLKEFAAEHGFNNQSDFGKFKHSLKKLGVNYDELRAATFAARDEQQAQLLDSLDDDAPWLALWVAAHDEDGKAAFAIVSDDRDALWYGNFFDDDRIWVKGNLVSAEQSVADKAVFLASKALKQAGHELGRVEITTTCPDLDTTALKSSGARLGVAVELIVDDDDDRALVMAKEPGFKKWQDNDLASLVVNDND